jgi:hypothetical protein
MKRAILAGVLGLVCAIVTAVETEPIIEVSTPMKSGGPLATMGYGATAKEQPFMKKITEKAIDLWADSPLPKPQNVSDAEWEKQKKEAEQEKAKLIPEKDYELAKQIGEYVGWFGIVRGISTDEKTGKTTLTLEHKYFDGLTDAHIHIVSIYGAGDFAASLPRKPDKIGLLSLVCVYGKVNKSDNGMPTIAPEYVRVWDWGLFTFMDYGKDKTNPKWLKLRKVNGRDAYDPRPDQKFYEDRLGIREEMRNQKRETRNEK